MYHFKELIVPKQILVPRANPSRLVPILGQIGVKTLQILKYLNDRQYYTQEDA